MCLTCRPTVNDVFSVEYWRDLEMCVRGCSRSLEMVPFDRSQTSSSSSSIVTMTVACTVVEIKRDIVEKRQFFILLFH